MDGSLNYSGERMYPSWSVPNDLVLSLLILAAAPSDTSYSHVKLPPSGASSMNRCRTFCSSKCAIPVRDAELSSHSADELLPSDRCLPYSIAMHATNKKIPSINAVPLRRLKSSAQELAS